MGIFGMITLDDILHWMPVISAVVLVAFDWGIIIQKLKGLVTKEEVGKIVDGKLKGHCPNTQRLRDIDLSVANLENGKMIIPLGE